LKVKKKKEPVERVRQPCILSVSKEEMQTKSPTLRTYNKVKKNPKKKNPKSFSSSNLP
jgi:hypothetical protein